MARQEADRSTERRHAAGGDEALTRPFAAAHLPPVEIRDLPPAQPLRRIIGPGIIAAGVGLSSGEFIIYPFIAANVGLTFLWAAFVGALTQFFINMEIERYTLATGETALTGFSRGWRHWGIFFAIGTLLANVWPGWATSAATVLTYAFGGGNPNLIAIAILVVIGAALTLSPVIYQTVERAEYFKVAAVLLFFAIAAVVAFTGEAVRELPSAVTNFGRLPTELGVALVLSAFAFAGGGGGQNLVQSNWIRDKRMGMGAHVPRLVSPITGQDQAAPATGYVFRPDEANMARWRGWWKVANREQFLTFFLITVLTITLTSLLAVSTAFGQDVADDVTFLQAEGEALNAAVGSWFGPFFWIIGAVSLFGASLGILDYTARLVADTVKVNYLGSSSTWTESRIYTLVVWGMIVVGSTVLLVGFDQPLVLLIIAASVGGFMMFVYSFLLIRLNRRVLPAPIRISNARVGVLVWAILLFGVLSGVTIWNQLSRG